MSDILTVSQYFATSDADRIKWSKLLGFRGTGITMAGTETAFAPSRECMMRWAGQPFCEVCKMELARKIKIQYDYVSYPQLYAADPRFQPRIVEPVHWIVIAKNTGLVRKTLQKQMKKIWNFVLLCKIWSIRNNI